VKRRGELLSTGLDTKRGLVKKGGGGENLPVFDRDRREAVANF